MKKTISIFTALLLTLGTLLLCASCDAPGVKLLDEQLPPLAEKTTGYAVTTAIAVTRMTTGDTVEFSTPTEVSAFHQRLEGVKCIRDKKVSGYVARYAVTFFTSDSAETFYICSDKDFIVGEYHYEAMRAGVDTVYLESLFPPMPEVEVPEGTASEANP